MRERPCGDWVFAAYRFALLPVPSHPLARWTAFRLLHRRQSEQLYRSFECVADHRSLQGPFIAGTHRQDELPRPLRVAKAAACCVGLIVQYREIGSSHASNPNSHVSGARGQTLVDVDRLQNMASGYLPVMSLAVALRNLGGVIGPHVADESTGTPHE